VLFDLPPGVLLEPVLVPALRRIFLYDAPGIRWWEAQAQVTPAVPMASGRRARGPAVSLERRDFRKTRGNGISPG